MSTQLEQRIAEVNGARRTRLLRLPEIVKAVELLPEGEHIFLHGGHVANSYGYEATATGAVVFRPRGKRRAYVLLRRVNAKKGCTGFGKRASWRPPAGLEDCVPVTRLDQAIGRRRELRRHFPPSTPWGVVADWWEDHGQHQEAILCRLLG